MNGAGAGPVHYTLASATAGAQFLQQQNDAALEVGAKGVTMSTGSLEVLNALPGGLMPHGEAVEVDDAGTSPP